MQTPYDIGLVIRAVEFAAQKHRMQRRKDSDASPFINHPIALMHALCIDGGITEPATLAQLLRSTTLSRTARLPKRSYGRCLAMGSRLSFLRWQTTSRYPKTECNRLQIAHAQHMSREAALVKLAHKICNLRDVAVNPPAEWSVERRIEYFEWAKAVVDGLPQVSAELLGLFNAAYTARAH